ncbi:MAG: tRNA (N(6)-L-threonylcarbamoyladenosine(37)-C(2))-methylthiotransferase MtaB [Stomatobaculum sp.]|nr:tRNA (N(6)-L-threonylcarbamoyladenosine(37)-C(2))-methylthiotransferase MtaB [Stomatobaculum sp.]
MRSVAFHTLGCKVNAYETEAMREALVQAGYAVRSFEEPADVYVINTCSVTNIADRKSRQMLHRARTMNPEAVIVAAGCYAQAAGEKLKDDLSVDIILGNHEKRDIAAVLERWFADDADARKIIAAVGDIGAVRCYDDMAAETMTEHTRAFLKIQDGCNQFCSYCIIPYVRGRVRSRGAEEILSEAEQFAAKGCRELVLTGIHIASYGKDFGPEVPVRDLAGVIRMLDGVAGIDRVRVGSLEPKIVTEEFVQMLSGLRTFCPHFHLSLQSGSDTVLKRMNRHYTTEEYLKGVELIRKYFPEAAITTDIICGFPGETEEEFQETLAFAEKVGFYEIHIFPYSVRQGTRAASMPGQLTKAEKAERVRRLSEIEVRQSREFRGRRIGREEEILTEETASIGGREWIVGNTREYVKIALPAECAGPNTLVRGRVKGFLDEEILEMEKTDRVS